jgi:hypothetical protein
MAKINLAQMFTGGGDPGAPITPRQMQLAQALMSSPSPGSIPTTGAGIAHIADKALRGYIAGDASRKEAAQEAEGNALMGQLAQMMMGGFGGGMGGDTGGADLPAPGAPSSTGSAPAPGMGEGDFVNQSGAPAQSFGGSQQDFISQMMPYAMEVSAQTGVDPRIIIAQGALESGWGKSAPGNNFFGIKSHGKPGGQTLATSEVINGQTQRINDSFRTFGSMGDSVRGYGEFLQQNPRYRPMMQAQGLDAQIEELARSGYATDPNYGSKIRSIAGGIQIAPPDVGNNMAAAPGVEPFMPNAADMPTPAPPAMGMTGPSPQSLAQMLGEPSMNVFQSGGMRGMAAGNYPGMGEFGMQGGQTPMQPGDPMSGMGLGVEGIQGGPKIMGRMLSQGQPFEPMPPDAPGGIVEQVLARQGGAPPMNIAPPQATYASGGAPQPQQSPMPQQMIDPNQYAGGDWIPPDVGRQLAAQQMQQAGQPVPQQLARALMGDQGGMQAPQAAMASMPGAMPQQGGMPSQGAPQGAQGMPQAPQGGQNFDAILQQALVNPRTRSAAIQILQQRQAAMQEQQQQQRLDAAADAAGIDRRLMADPALARAVLAQQSGGAGGDATMGLTPIYGEDAEGNPVLLQMSNRGGVATADLPEGVQIRRDPIRIDAGTQTILLDPITRQQIGVVPKNNREAASETAAGTVEGRTQAESVANAPNAVVQADTILSDIDSIINDPGLDNTVGWGSYVPFDIPGFNAETRSRLNKLEGQAFLQAFESLKGGGQITEPEGKKATQAIARLGQAQTPSEFRKALGEFREVIAAARDRSARRLPQGQDGGQGEPSAAVAPSRSGSGPRIISVEPVQ